MPQHLEVDIARIHGRPLSILFNVLLGTVLIEMVNHLLRALPLPASREDINAARECAIGPRSGIRYERGKDGRRSCFVRFAARVLWFRPELSAGPNR